MADVKVRFTGTQPIIVNGVTWYQDEIHTVHEKLANALVALRVRENDVFVLPAPELTMDDGRRTTDEQRTDGADEGADTDDGAEVVAEVAPKRKRK